MRNPCSCRIGMVDFTMSMVVCDNRTLGSSKVEIFSDNGLAALSHNQRALRGAMDRLPVVWRVDKAVGAKNVERSRTVVEVTKPGASGDSLWDVFAMMP